MDDLIRPDAIDPGPAILFSSILLGYLFASLRLRSIIGLAAWSFMVLAFVGAILLDLSLLYFWVATLITTFGLVAGGIIYLTRGGS